MDSDPVHTKHIATIVWNIVQIHEKQPEDDYCPITIY